LSNNGFPYTLGADRPLPNRAAGKRTADEDGVDAAQLKKLVTAVARSGDAEVARFW